MASFVGKVALITGIFFLEFKLNFEVVQLLMVCLNFNEFSTEL